MAPRCSVLTTVHDPDPAHLEACLASVQRQTIDDWQHVLVDVGSTDPRVSARIDASAADRRVIVVRPSASNDRIAALRAALAAATGEVVAILDQGDVLEPSALATMCDAMNGADLAYSDHDLIDVHGHHVAPSLKPDFSPERLRCDDYVQNLVVARRDLVDAVGGFRPGPDGAARYDLVLRMTERTNRIVHVPQVLYHRRGSTAPGLDGGVAATTDALAGHLARVGIEARVEDGLEPGTHRIRREVPARRVSVIIPTRGSSRPVWGRTRCFVTEAVRSLCERSTHPDLEFVVVYDTGTPDAVLRTLGAVAGDRLRLVEFGDRFNFSTKVNVGAAAATGELLLILNDDTELIVPDSVETMAALLDDPTVGMVGPKLRFADGTIQDGGHVYHEHLLGGLVGWSGERGGPRQLRPLAVTREVSGVTAAAAMIRHDVFDEIGGFDPTLWMNFNDVDVSLKVRATGRRILWTPDASWYHFESQTRPPTAEPEEFAEIDRRWHDQINRDPYYHPCMVGRRADWLELPWHSGHPPIDDVDTQQTTWTWVRTRLLGISADDPWAWLSTLRIPLLTLAVALLAVAIDRSSGATSGWTERLATTWFPVAVMTGAVAASVRRERWALAGGVFVAASPAWLGAIAAGVVVATGWAVAVLAALAYGPLRRRGRAPAFVAAVGGATAVGGTWWWHAVHDADPARSRRWDVVAPPLGDWGTAAVIAVVAWGLGAAMLAGWAWRAGTRWVAAAVSGAVVLALGIAWLLDATEGQPAAAGAIGMLGGAVVAASARVDHRADGTRATFVVAAVATVVGWIATAVATGERDGTTIALVVFAAVAAAASLSVIATPRRDAPFADPALAESRQGRPGEDW